MEMKGKHASSAAGAFDSQREGEYIFICSIEFVCGIEVECKDLVTVY